VKKLHKYLLITFLFIFFGCEVTKQAILIDAKNGTKIIAKFTDSNATGGKCEVVMPDGEILVGQYQGIRGTDVISFSNSVGNINANTNYRSNTSLNTINANTQGTYSMAGSQRTVGGQGKAYAILTSTKPGSTLVMEIIAIYNVIGGGGFGDAKTNDGRVYKVIF
jgi:hypothetical protein